MENGQRNQQGTHVGKTIIFARNHKHAVVLHEVFNELYPQYGGKFCQIIDNYDPRQKKKQLSKQTNQPNKKKYT